jgi:hypothetical protein
MWFSTQFNLEKEIKETENLLSPLKQNYTSDREFN